MRNFGDKEILDRVEQLSTFTGWKKGVYDIWVRSSADAFDQFDDKAFTYQCKADGQRPTFFMSRAGTTNAGSYGLKHFEDYNHEGCAVLKSDVIMYGSHTYGLHKGKPAYRQAKSWDYYRDNNRNNRTEEIGKVHTGIIGANIHRAGANSTVIKNWSTACLVTANQAKFLAFLAFMKAQGNPALNVAILREANIGKNSVADSSPAKSDPQGSASPVIPPDDSTPPPTAQIETTSTTVETEEGTKTATTTTASLSEPVTVKTVAIGLWTKIVAGVGALTAMGLNAGTLIETKLAEITLNQIILMGFGVAILIVVIWYVKSRQQSADTKTHALIEAAADKDRHTIHLTK